jgi:hypothetical protein
VEGVVGDHDSYSDSPTSFLTRDAGEDEGGEWNDWNYWNDLNRFAGLHNEPVQLAGVLADDFVADLWG